MSRNEVYATNTISRAFPAVVHVHNAKPTMYEASVMRRHEALELVCLPDTLLDVLAQEPEGLGAHERG